MHSLARFGKILVFICTFGFAYPNVFAEGTAGDVAPGGAAVKS